MKFVLCLAVMTTLLLAVGGRHKAGCRRTDRKVYRILSRLVRGTCQGAGLLQRAVHGHALRLTAALRTPCPTYRDAAGALKDIWRWADRFAIDARRPVLVVYLPPSSSRRFFP